MAILTISREFGSGGREIGRAVADALGYEYVDKERILGEVSERGKKWEEWSKDLDERCPTVWERYDWSFRGFGALVQHAIFNYAVQNQVVIMGRGGNLVLQQIPHAFRIRVIAGLKARVAHIMKREDVDQDTAKWLAEKTDHERGCFIQALYGKPWDDPSLYDRTFNTSEESRQEIVGIIQGELLKKDRLFTPEAEKTLAMQALAARVRAGLLTDARIFVPILDVFASGDQLVLRGIIHNAREHERVEKAAKQLAGEVLLKCELHYRG